MTLCPPPHYDMCMAKKPLAGSPVPCPRCRADLPLHHPGPGGFIDCQTCGPVPVTPRAHASVARAAIEAATLRQAEERDRRMRNEAAAARRHAQALIQRNRERRARLTSPV